MTPTDPARITLLLRSTESGDPESAQKLFELLQAELRDIAERHFSRQAPGHTLQPTALVSEAFVKLLGGAGVAVNDRAHFLALASRVMRQILVNHARGKSARKRLSHRRPLELLDAEAVFRDGIDPHDLLDVDQALTSLAALDERKARLIELRFFAGMSEVEAAEALGLSRTQAARDWNFARAWLLAALQSDGNGETK